MATSSASGPLTPPRRPGRRWTRKRQVPLILPATAGNLRSSGLLLDVPKDERDRVQRFQVIDRAAAAIAAARALVKELPPVAEKPIVTTTTTTTTLVPGGSRVLDDGRNKEIPALQVVELVEAVIMRYDTRLGKYDGKPHPGGPRSTLCVSSQVINCPNLNEISLDFTRQENDSTDLVTMMDTLGSTCPLLRNLHVASIRLSNAAVLAVASARLRDLCMLSLVRGSKITDASVASLVSSYTDLELLDLSGSGITDSGIGMICNVYSETLSRLLLALCPNVTSSFALKLSRAQ